MAHNPRHDLDGETLGLDPQMRTIVSTLRDQRAQATEQLGQEDAELESKRVFGQPILDLIVRTYERIRHTEDNK